MKLPKLFGTETKDSAASATIVTTPGQPVWSNRDYAKFADEAYRRNVVAYRAINIVSDGVASAKFTVWNGDNEVIAGPLVDLIDRPNPNQSLPEFIRAKVGYHLIAGNSYDERVDVGGVPRELYTLRPDRMKVIPDASGSPSGYVYSVGGKSTSWVVDIKTGESPIRHMKSFNPLDDWYGLSPVEAGAYSVDQHNEAMAWMQSLLQNSATPSGALKLADDKTLTPEQFNQLKVELESHYQGSHNAGRPMLLEGGLDWVEMGLSPTDMGIIETKYSSARDVALAFGVPPMLIGIPGDNTYANYKEARLSLWEDTVIPLAEYIAREWSNWLGGGEFDIRIDVDHIPAIVEKRRSLWDMADKSDDLTINERRAIKGYEPLPDGDAREQIRRVPMSPDMMKAIAYGDD